MPLTNHLTCPDLLSCSGYLARKCLAVHSHHRCWQHRFTHPHLPVQGVKSRTGSCSATSQQPESHTWSVRVCSAAGKCWPVTWAPTRVRLQAGTLPTCASGRPTVGMIKCSLLYPFATRVNAGRKPSHCTTSHKARQQRCLQSGLQQLHDGHYMLFTCACQRSRQSFALMVCRFLHTSTVLQRCTFLQQQASGC